MSTTYKVISGDTFDSIARKKYGSEKEISRITKANPGVNEPLSPGITITIPDKTDAPKNSPQQAETDNDDEVALLIDGQRFRFWSDIRITRSIDTIDIIEINAPFDHKAKGFKETFRPFSYKKLEVTIGGIPFFTGTMVAVNPNLTETNRVISVSGYSLPGVLNDCTAPASAYPLEFNKQGLEQIAKTLAEPFGITVKFEVDQGAIFDRVAIEPDKRIMSFLTDLAKQRNLIITSSATGELIFTTGENTSKPVALLKQGESPLMSIIPTFSEQEYYSHITGIEPVVVGLKGSQFTVENPRLKGTTRPLTYLVNDTLNADMKKAVEAKAGRMFGNMVSYQTKVATIRDPQGELWKPGSKIKVQANDAMIYSEYEFQIRSLQFEFSSNSRIATHDLIIPDSFNGKIPENFPWDG